MSLNTVIKTLLNDIKEPNQLKQVAAFLIDMVSEENTPAKPRATKSRKKAKRPAPKRTNSRPMFAGVEYRNLPEIAKHLKVDIKDVMRIKRFATASGITDLAEVSKHKPEWFPKTAKTILRKA
jgi:hypothetical protein